MSSLQVPVIAVITGEGNSGGALAIAVANSVLMFEHAVYSILSPEGFASILYKDASQSENACEAMKMTAADLYEFGMIDKIIREPADGMQSDWTAAFKETDKVLRKELAKYEGLTPLAVAKHRYHKFRRMDEKKIISRDM